MKLTRRQMALAAAGSVITAPALAQTSAPAAPDWDRVAREAHQKSALELAKVNVPMFVEPAFEFKA